MVSLRKLQEKLEFTRVNVEELINDWYNLLFKFNHRVSKYAIMVTLDTFVDNNMPLLKLMVNHPDYNGNLQIVSYREFNRDIDRDEVYRNVTSFCSRMGAKDKLYKTVDAEGNSLQDYILKQLESLPKKIKLSEIDSIETKNVELASQFDKYGFYKPSKKRYENLASAINLFSNWNDSTVSDSLAYALNSVDAFKIAAGMKTSRAFNRIFTFYGLEKDKKYLECFAEYADLINPIIRKLPYVISLNPLDFLTMSFGNNWASCHTIDKNNTRNRSNGYSGGYCGGTLSYMLDGVSLVTYVTKADKECCETHPERLDKIYRNMMHYTDGWLIQGRVYPQANDGATDLYKHLRTLFQEAWSKCLEQEDSWVAKRGWAGDYSSYIYSRGAHYRDYTNFDSCNLSYHKAVAIPLDDLCMNIGHHGIDQYSGEEYSANSALGSWSSDFPSFVANEETILP